MKSLILFPFFALFAATAAPSDKNDFSSVVDDSSPKCVAAKKHLEADQRLQNCTSHISLYYSTTANICANSCPDRVTKASALIVSSCKLDLTWGPHRAYQAWSFAPSMRAACQLEHNRSCLSQISSVIGGVENIKYNLGDKKENIAMLHCESACLRNLYGTVKKGINFPTLYYQGGELGPDIWSTLGQYCNWNNQTKE